MVGQCAKPLLLQGFADVDEVVGVSAGAGFVEVAHGRNAKDVLPAVLLAKDVKHLALLAHRPERTGVGRIGQAQEESFTITDEVEARELACANEQ